MGKEGSKITHNQYSVTRNGQTIYYTKEEFIPKLNAGEFDASDVQRITATTNDPKVKQAMREYEVRNKDRFEEKTVENSEKSGKFEERSLEVNQIGNIARNKAEALINVLEYIEPKVTDDLINISKNNGGKLEGLEYRLKSVESLERKLISDGINAPMNDVLRYTIIIIDEDLTKVINSILEDLESKGYKTIKLKNTFQEGQIYKGINTNVKAPNGNIFEIQYHTSESFNIKQNINHPLYEEYRLLDKTSPESIKLEQQMIENSSIIKLPQNINTIKSY